MYQRAFDKQKSLLRRSHQHVMEYLDKIPSEKWSLSVMARLGVPTFGHCTSNCVEQTNGTIREERSTHPYEMTDLMIQRFSRQQQIDFDKLKSQQRKKLSLTSYAHKLFTIEFDLSRNPTRKYQISSSGNDVYLVQDVDAKGIRIRHTVCIDVNSSKCSPCDTWGNHLLCCRHMLLVRHFQTPTTSDHHRGGKFSSVNITPFLHI